MRIYHFIILFCLASPIFAQINLQGKIVDLDSKEPIPYANIGVAALGIGTVSDDQGQFTLEVESQETMISISSIGYKTLRVSAKDLKGANAVWLKRMEYELELVEVEAPRLKKEEVILGERNKKRGLSIAFGSPQLGTQIGAIINIKEASYIKSANFVLNHAKGDSLLFRVNIYAYQDGEIGENLLKENILIKEKQRKGTISIDMEPYNLILDSEVLLALEWIRDFDELGNKAITFDTKRGKKPHGVYVKYSSATPFALMPHKMKLKPCFYFVAQQVEEVKK